MNQAGGIQDKVLAVLDCWSGYETVESILLECSDLDIYVAGGVPRDVILERPEPVKDVDFFIGGEGIDNALALLERAGTLIRGPFGSPRWIPSGSRGLYADFIPISAFFNGLWFCEDIIDVLNQFDFTVNAIAVDLRTGRLFDPLNGYRDAHRGVMKAVRFDYPDEPFQRNQKLTRLAVVWFRILHYAAMLGLTIEPVTLSWLCAHRSYASFIAEFERIFFALDAAALTPVKGNCHE